MITVMYNFVDVTFFSTLPVRKRYKRYILYHRTLFSWHSPTLTIRVIYLSGPRESLSWTVCRLNTKAHSPDAFPIASYDCRVHAGCNWIFLLWSSGHTGIRTIVFTKLNAIVFATTTQWCDDSFGNNLCDKIYHTPSNSLDCPGA